MFIVLLLLAGFAGVALGGKYNKVLSPGDAAPDWKEVPGVDGKKYSLADFKDKDVLVVVFTCNSCDYAQDVEDRLAALGKKFAKDGNCALVAVCPSPAKVEEDSPEELVKKSKEKGFNFPYLLDPTQQIVRDFGAVRTPEFFVFNKDRKLVYQGNCDDSPEGKKITKRYVEDAVAAALAGTKPAVEETAPIGCMVRYIRMRPTGKK
ncbi:MAG: thioredoxin family protein [Pirellulaceae bacterium]|nr:thioredoxin family protein [Pirellulaceae bacterium]